MATMTKPQVVPPPLPETHRSPDSLIRWAGFVIADRPRVGQAVWRMGKVRVLHESALSIARQKWRENLKSLEVGK